MSSSSSSDAPALRLYTTWTSSCAHRLWIALAYKSLPYESVYVNLSAKEHHGADYLSRVNPHARVPTLEVNFPESPTLWLRNSLTSLLWLESHFPSQRLLPPESDWQRRALVLDLVGIIQADTQPVCNSSAARRAAEWAVGKTLEEGADREEVIKKATRWRVEAIKVGLKGFEGMIAGAAGKFSVGDDFTLADVVLFPQVLMARA